MNNEFNELNGKSLLSLLDFFCRHPSRSFYVRETSRESGLSVGACNAALRLLEKRGFLKASRRGNQLHYSLEATNPVVKQFRIFLSVLALQPVVEAVKQHCEKMILYGSRAFGEETEESDFDLLVLAKEVDEVKKIISQKKFGKLSALVVDGRRLLALKTRERPFYERIMSGIELWRFR